MSWQSLRWPIDLAAPPAVRMMTVDYVYQRAVRQYLLRDHQFRHRLGAFAAIPRRALIDAGFGFFGGEAFAATGWRSFAALFGSAHVRSLGWFTTKKTAVRSAHSATGRR